MLSKITMKVSIILCFLLNCIVINNPVDSREMCVDDANEERCNTCEPLYTSTEFRYPTACSEVLGNSDVYLIQPAGAKEPFPVFCETQDLGGGWTVIQQRYDGRISFIQPWKNYEAGFGHINCEYWLGLEKIHILTKSYVNELLVYLEDFCGNWAYSHYADFLLGGNETDYALIYLSSYSGTAGDSLSSHAGHKFSTFDRDNDASAENCAAAFPSGWWFTNCFHSNLNGIYYNQTAGVGKGDRIAWNHWNSPLKRVRIMVRPKYFTSKDSRVSPFPSRITMLESLNSTTRKTTKKGSSTSKPPLVSKNKTVNVIGYP